MLPVKNIFKITTMQDATNASILTFYYREKENQITYWRRNSDDTLDPSKRNHDQAKEEQELHSWFLQWQPCHKSASFNQISTTNRVLQSSSGYTRLCHQLLNCPATSKLNYDNEVVDSLQFSFDSVHHWHEPICNHSLPFCSLLKLEKRNNHDN